MASRKAQIIIDEVLIERKLKHTAASTSRRQTYQLSGCKHDQKSLKQKRYTKHYTNTQSVHTHKHTVSYPFILLSNITSTW